MSFTFISILCTGLLLAHPAQGDQTTGSFSRTRAVFGKHSKKLKVSLARATKTRKVLKKLAKLDRASSDP